MQSFLAKKETGTQGGRGGSDYAGGEGIIDVLLIRTVSWQGEGPVFAEDLSQVMVLCGNNKQIKGAQDR